MNQLHGDTDGTQEVPEPIDRDEVMQWVRVLFHLMGLCKIDDQQRAFSVGKPPTTGKSLISSFV